MTVPKPSGWHGPERSEGRGATYTAPLAALGDVAPHAPTPKIALIRQKYRLDGGAERFVANLLSVLTPEAYDVTLFTRAWDSGSERSIVTCNPPRLGRVWRDWGFARAVRRELRWRRFDLVQSAERIAGCDLYRAGDGVHREWLRQRRRLQSPLARWLTLLSPYHAYVKRAERRLFESPRLRAVVCNSQMVRDEIVRYFRIDASKLRVVYSGVDVERFHPGLKEHRAAVRAALGISENAAAFIFVGSGFARKGLRQAIRGLARVDGAHLIVVGKDKRLASYGREAERLGLRSRVRFLGVQSDVGRYYGAADALVLPAIYDPFPNVALEAMACGLPVVTSTKCGAAELVIPGENGYVCDALNVGALAAAIERLSDREHCRRLGHSARQTVLPYTLEAMRRNLQALYTELLNGQG